MSGCVTNKYPCVWAVYMRVYSSVTHPHIYTVLRLLSYLVFTRFAYASYLPYLYDRTVSTVYWTHFGLCRCLGFRTVTGLPAVFRLRFSRLRLRFLILTPAGKPYPYLQCHGTALTPSWVFNKAFHFIVSHSHTD
jgi:hypothetical protein